MNVPDKNIGFDYRLNGVSIGSPMPLKTINIVSDGLASFDAGTGVLTINLHPKSGESLILRGSGAPAPETGNNGDPTTTRPEKPSTRSRAAHGQSPGRWFQPVPASCFPMQPAAQRFPMAALP